MQDRYGNTISTSSSAARDAYVDGVDRFIAAEHGAEAAFGRAIEADPTFALAHIGLARSRQAVGNGKGAGEAIAAARACGGPMDEREAAHFNAFGLWLDGDGAAAYKAFRAHAAVYPRDAMVAQTCTGVFGLIGFSGQPGREAEQLAFTASLLPHYGDDWWFLGQHAFAQGEAGQIGPAMETVERSLAGNPRNAHAAHIKAHIHYEAGETDAGFAYMGEWRKDYNKRGALHCHISWHVALWALERGDVDLMWRTLDADVVPGGAWGPSLNILTDNAAILYRAELAGVDVPAERWRAISAYASEFFPNAGIAFADVHAALAHAMAGDGEALAKIVREAKGPAGDLVKPVAEAFGALAAENWAEAANLLAPAMSGHERIGGSRAQRDLLEYALLNALLKMGKTDEAHRMLRMRRPLKVPAHAVNGL